MLGTVDRVATTTLAYQACVSQGGSKVEIEALHGNLQQQQLSELYYQRSTCESAAIALRCAEVKFRARGNQNALRSWGSSKLPPRQGTN